MATTIKGLLPTGKLPSAAKAEVIELIKTEAPVPDMSRYATKEDLSKVSAFGVPIFATLSELKAWEEDNPGKVGLTLEGEDVEIPEAPTGPIIVTPGTTLATEDFGSTTQVFSGGNQKTTTAGGLKWGTWDYKTQQPREGYWATSAGKLAATSAAATLAVPTHKLDVSFDYDFGALTEASGLNYIDVFVGGYVFELSLNALRYRIMKTAPWGVGKDVTMNPETFKKKGRGRVTYDGITFTTYIDDVQVNQLVGDGRSVPRVAINISGGNIGSGGDFLSASPISVDNVEVKYFG